MKEIRYNIDDFDWVKEDNTFYGYRDNLFPDWSGYTGSAFPNDKDQFTIFNAETGGFRRFRFVKESVFEDGSGKEYIFESEDGIFANILIDYGPPDFDITFNEGDID